MIPAKENLTICFAHAAYRMKDRFELRKTGIRNFEVRAYDDLVKRIDDFRPQAILLSAGFDAHRRDPLGGMDVTEKAFGEITRRIVECAERHCDGRVLSLLEGGYDMEGLAAGVAEHLNAMNGG